MERMEEGRGAGQSKWEARDRGRRGPWLGAFRTGRHMSDAGDLREEVGSLKGRETESRAFQYEHSCRRDSSHLSCPEWSAGPRAATKRLWLKFYLSVKGAGAWPRAAFLGCGGDPRGPICLGQKD